MGSLRRVKRVCVLASGGFDSSALIADYLDRGFEVHPFFARSGFYWEKAELHWLKRFLRALKGRRLKPLTVADVPMNWIMGDHWSMTGRKVPSSRAAWDSVYLPGRNLLLLGQAGVYAATHGVGVVALGVLKGNPFADSSPKFLKDMQSAINDALRSRLSVEAPYTRLSKAQVSKRMGQLQTRFPLELTFSCLHPRGLKPCGRCSKCGETRTKLR
ncbi:MAG: 7-cyano-7-deazaguanine synthase [Elusimicrobia bacterium]|nr:7-cyano-7-deazaguanine synthase [Elusimicrobiota bacterium]